ncbi:O-antigen/teichoic acid export membrane protein [Saccharothrix tamanrassetensis]|uniref:O-antigen/teichoic acid export membrane protein n=1 Tax=Saccharothrix tamanrassetensis TaxID=1051531 RepID=A0A841CTT8_9PSEU|nr:hypothetical protein [Saccharothrix tamanrassetensis]MBB5958846.1 O-antigen/teichoic acid export membrane protein [Saccharothrix tamanrassetensis]
MSSGARREGLIVLVASFAGHAGNYLFYLIAARMVTPPEFAAISALIAFGTIVSMAVNGIQVATARDVAVLRTSGTPAELSGYLRRLGRRMGLVSLAIAVVLSGLSPLLADRLNIGAARPVVFAAVWVATTALLLVVTGVAQGTERFRYVAFALAGPLGALRPVLLPLFVLVAGMSGSMLAMLAATLVGLAVMAPPVVRDMKVPPVAPPPMPSTIVTMIGLLAFSSLTNVDLLVAQAMLPEIERAHYAGAVLLGKVALFAPSALAMVLLPRAAAALERGERADGLVLKTMALTAAGGLAVALGLWLVPTALLTGTFGPAYGESKPLLAPLALVMTAAAVLWVHLMFAIAKKSTRMVVGLVGTAVAHWALLAFLHDSAQHIVVASAVAIGSALLAIEFVSGDGVLRMVLNARRAGRETPATTSPA